MRGEHSAAFALMRSASGSSPLARGAHHHFKRRWFVHGIIPACAGSTKWVRFRKSRPKDHPRLRGEHGFVTPQKDVVEGSSPLARGALDSLLNPRVAGGIIPACAGSTRTSWSLSLTRRDHPRLRGEHRLHRLLLVIVSGSSPLARGARARSRPVRRAGRIIPACAGSTSRSSRRSSARRDHPRLRGEHHSGTLSRDCSGGSSPLARGAPAAHAAASVGRGIIPACAGSTVPAGSS